MRSYYAHLETTAPQQKTAVTPKPVFRASAIFPVFQMRGISSRILFLGYWILKRNIREIASVITLRSLEGKILARSNMLIQEAKTYRIELSDQLTTAGLDPEQEFAGSLEVEFYSTTNLVFPYPAVVVNYYGPQFSSVVHTAQRVYNDFDDMRNNSQSHVPESGFNIYADDTHEPFIGLINGAAAVPDCKVKFEFYNSDKATLSYEYDLGMLEPYQTKILFPARDVPLKEFLKGKVGAAKAYFRVNWIFPRLLAGNFQRTLPAISITHTYYDCTGATSDTDYWKPTQPEWHPASQMVPVSLEGRHFTNLYFYPIYSPSTFHVDVELYSSSGTLLGSKKSALTITSPGTKFEKIDFKALCQELNIPTTEKMAARIISRPAEGSRLPSRIKMGLDVGEKEPEMPCNICNNLQPFIPAFETKPSSFKWAPILADQPYAATWILNSAPNVTFTKVGNMEITFHHEQDDTTLKRSVPTPPHGFLVICPQEDPELKAFFGGHPGWLTITTNNPYSNIYYFAENPSGVVGGDHGF